MGVKIALGLAYSLVACSGEQLVSPQESGSLLQISSRADSVDGARPSWLISSSETAPEEAEIAPALVETVAEKEEDEYEYNEDEEDMQTESTTAEVVESVVAATHA